MEKKLVDIYNNCDIISSCFYYEATIIHSSCFFMKQFVSLNNWLKIAII